MSNKFGGLFVKLFLLSAAVTLSGCGGAALFSGSSSAPENAKSLLAGEKEGTTSHKTYSEEGDNLFEKSHLVTQDMLYEPLKVVFSRSEEEPNGTGINGPYLTYLDLLKQASELGGHDIINVRIERIENCVKLKKSQPECKNVRYGSALAIRYIKPVVKGELIDKNDHYYYKPLEANQKPISTDPPAKAPEQKAE